MTDTTQEELPPLPPIVGAPWIASTVERYARNYALSCIATLRAENEQMHETARANWLSAFQAVEQERNAAQSQAMAGLLEDLRINLDLLDVWWAEDAICRIDEALAAWKGDGE